MVVKKKSHFMKRIYELVIEEHFDENRQMFFLVGPRQVGKTTESLKFSRSKPNHFYYNWDIRADQLKIIEGPDAIAKDIGFERARKGKAIIIFDELHKFRKWKNFLKGFYDKYSE